MFNDKLAMLQLYQEQLL